MLLEHVEMWGKGGVKFCLPNLPSGNGHGVKRDNTPHQKNLYLISKLLPLCYWTASVKLSVRNISLCTDCKCVTTGLAPDGVVDIDWESFTLRFQSLIAFQAPSLFDGEVLAWSVVNTEIVFSVSHSLLIQLFIWSTEPLWILTFIWNALSDAD